VFLLAHSGGALPLDSHHHEEKVLENLKAYFPINISEIRFTESSKVN
jgi:hypothetical protein